MLVSFYHRRFAQFNLIWMCGSPFPHTSHLYPIVAFVSFFLLFPQAVSADEHNTLVQQHEDLEREVAGLRDARMQIAEQTSAINALQARYDEV